MTRDDGSPGDYIRRRSHIIQRSSLFLLLFRTFHFIHLLPSPFPSFSLFPSSPTPVRRVYQIDILGSLEWS